MHSRMSDMTMKGNAKESRRPQSKFMNLGINEKPIKVWLTAQQLTAYCYFSMSQFPPQNER